MPTQRTTRHAKRTTQADGRRRRPRHVPLYFAHAVPGIEDLAAAELTRLGATVHETLAGFDKRDSIIVFTAPEPALALEARLLDDAFALVLDAAVPPGKATARAIALKIERDAFERALLLHHAVRPKAARTFKAVARVAGRQTFKRENLETAIERVVVGLLPRWSVADAKASVEVWAHIVGERVLVGVRISGDELAQRRYKRAHLPASLKPTVAAALVALSEPRPDDVFLDPMCGAGTVLRERADAGRALVLGGDIDAAALEAAITNAGRSARLACWDAANLPLRDRSVDAIICNPPYGRQHEAARGLERLYARATREMARVLRPDGRCVLLTGEPALLFRVLPPPLRVVSRRRILLRGLPVTAFVMVRA
jgi:23S rRNA G2445 N2-methylase RlmL